MEKVKLIEAKCELSTEQLIEELKNWSDKLAESGGEAWTLRIPVDANKDPDCLIYEVCNRLKKEELKFQELKEKLEGERFALLDLNKSRATGRNNEFEKGIDRGLEIALNLINDLDV